MGDVFDFDEDSLASNVQKRLEINQERSTNSIGSDVAGSVGSVGHLKKFRSNSVVSVGTIGNRLGTSYEVQLDEFYESESRANSRNPYIAASEAPVVQAKPTMQDFEQLKVLGKGAYGKVLLIRHRKSGKLYAQKQLRKASMIVNAENYERTLTERTILKNVRHPNIVKLVWALQDFDKVYLILEYLQGGELFHHLREEGGLLSESVASYYVAEMILALHHLHTRAGVIYRDIKPENCMLNSKGHLVLTDFGLSKESEECHSLFGTAEYVAPEVIRGEHYDSQCDWWSLGAVAYDMLTGAPPFTGKDSKKIMDKVLKQKVKYPFFLSQDAKSFLSHLLNKDPAKRLNVDKNFDKVKAHRFFKGIDWDALIAQDDVKLPPPIVPIITDPAAAENFDSEFTRMRMTPPSSPIKESMWRDIADDEESRVNSNSSFIPIKKQELGSSVKESVYFKGFSYTNEALLH